MSTLPPPLRRKMRSSGQVDRRRRRNCTPENTLLLLSGKECPSSASSITGLLSQLAFVLVLVLLLVSVLPAVEASSSSSFGCKKDHSWTRFLLRAGASDTNYENTAQTRNDGNETTKRIQLQREDEKQEDGIGKDDEEWAAAAARTTATTTTTTTSAQTIRTKQQKKQQFLDRIAVISSSLMRKVEPEDEVITVNAATVTGSSSSTRRATPFSFSNFLSNDKSDASNNVGLDEITPQSDLSLPGRHIHIVTTAALPWFTGTAVNPLLRAAYLHRTTQAINSNSNKTKNEKTERWVTFVIPWLEWPEDQQTLYGGRVFANCSEQEDYIRAWLRDEADMADAACPVTGLEILFYPARYHAGLGSIFAMGDILETVVTNNSNHNNTATSNYTINNLTSDATSNSIGNDVERHPLDVCFLEEPEHCNWYRAPGDGWTKRFNFVVGIVHTNYKEYANAHYSGLWTAPAIALMSSAMVRAYCHKVIKLSNTLQSFAVEKESTSNVHGVRSNFWQEGVRRSQMESPWKGTDKNGTHVYFIGKLLWTKGLDLMLELEDYYKQYSGDYFSIDIYGTGPDQLAISRAFHGRKLNNGSSKGPSDMGETSLQFDNKSNAWRGFNVSSMDSSVLVNDNEVKPGLRVKAQQTIAQLKETMSVADLQERTKEHLTKIKESMDLPLTFAELVRRQPIPATFPGRVDHGLLAEHYKIFMNPSISEVLCTTTAEALAMGKFAIVPVHPSNTFFLQFPNCLAYRNKFEFVANLRWALTHDPEPLTAEQSRQFTWEAATERLMAASAITWREAHMRERLGLAKLDERIAWFHNELGKGTSGDFLRRVLGAGPASHQVKYQLERESGDGSATRDDETGETMQADLDDEEDESGFSSKFRFSSFASAIRATLGDFSAFGTP